MLGKFSFPISIEKKDKQTDSQKEKQTKRPKKENVQKEKRQ